jgi:hypothetical protein
LADIGRKLTESWLARLTVPGMLYVAALLAAVDLGWRHAIDFRRLAATIDEWAKNGKAPTAALILAVGLLGLAGAGFGIAADGIGSWIARIWPGENWRRWRFPFHWIAAKAVERRTARWNLASKAFNDAVNGIVKEISAANAGIAPEPEYDLAEIGSLRAQLGRKPPDRPTWIGDRLLNVRQSLLSNYGLDLPSVWPALTLHMPAPAVEAVESARIEYRRAATLAAWGLMYLGLGVFWVPGLLIGVVTLLTARQRARDSVDRYALLVEAATLLHAPSLIQGLGIDSPSGLDRASGEKLTRRLRGDPFDA